MRRSPSLTRLLVAVCIGCGLVGVSACSGDDAPATALDEVAPTKAEVASDAGITFPASTGEFRLVRVGAGQIDVTFTIAADEVDEFATGSGFSLTDGERSITHASPLWDVAVTGTVAGGASARNDVDRATEVIVEGDTATVRLTLRPQNAG